MQIKYGTSRIVVLIPILGIAVKFPRIYILRVIREIYFVCTRRKRRKDLWRFLTYKPEVIGGFSYLVLGGLICNLSEFLFYVKTRNGFAWPTYFSFFGLFNIQKIGRAPNHWISRDVFCSVYSITGMDMTDLHVFAEAENYAVCNVGLCLLDYASPNSQFVLQKYEKSLVGRFANFQDEFSSIKQTDE